MAKKTSKTTETESKAEGTAKAPKATKSAKAAAPAASKSQAAPGVDPHQHAQGAAASLVARLRQQAGPKASTGHVDKLKEGLKPQLPASSPFAQTQQPTKSHQPNSPFGQQRGHHQNNGPNVARTGVPRRTSGG
jgi:hypothetical protein